MTLVPKERPMLRASLVALAVSAVLLVTGCPAEAPSAQQPAPTAPSPASTDTPAAGDRSDTRVATKEWCAEHGVPEAVCTRCNAGLIDGFKAKKDWCAEHGLPESQCVPCNPEVEAKWKALAPQ